MARRKHREPKLTPTELAETLAKPLMVVTKAGALRNGNELGHGRTWHMAPSPHWNGHKALCGAFPSIQWTTWGDPAPTCPKCIALHQQWSDDGFTEANNEAHLARLP